MGNSNKLASGVVVLLIGAFLAYTLANSLFTPTSTAATAVNSTMTTAGYGTEGNLMITAFKLLLTALGIGVIVIGAKFVIDGAKGL